MDLRAMTAPGGSEPTPDRARDDTETLRCSAKGCRRAATQALRWNNPRLHTPERRKVWLACDEHEVSLRDFLDVRGFYRDTVAPADLSPTDG